VKKRIGGRRVCDCGAAYHTIVKPPKVTGKCDLCGKKLYRRPDDTPAVIKKRLEDYHQSIKPLISYFNHVHHYIKINGRQPIKKVEQDIKKAIKNYDLN
jgi:adenylate kinase